MQTTGKRRALWRVIVTVCLVCLLTCILSWSTQVVLRFTFWVICNGAPLNADALEWIRQASGYASFFLQEAVMIAVPLCAWRMGSKQPVRAMGVVPLSGHRSELAKGLFLGAAGMGTVFLALIVTGQADVAAWKITLHPTQLIWLFLFILVGIAEEILSRGYVMSELRGTKSIALILGVNGILFALMHGGNPGISPIAMGNLVLVGILTGVMYLFNGTLWMPIGFHIAWNYVQGCVFGLPVSGLPIHGMLTTIYPHQTHWNGGSFGPEGGIWVTVVSLVLVCLLVWNGKGRQNAFFA